MNVAKPYLARILTLVLFAFAMMSPGIAQEVKLGVVRILRSALFEKFVKNLA